jgi:hypothetical protein
MKAIEQMQRESEGIVNNALGSPGADESSRYFDPLKMEGRQNIEFPGPA